MHFKLTYIIAVAAIVANAAPVTMDPNGVSLGEVLPSPTASPSGTFDRGMNDTSVVNTAAACGIAFHAAETAVVASHDLSATLTGLISQTKAITSLASIANVFKTLWPGYFNTIAPEFKPFASTLPPTDAICKGQINVCLSSMLSTSKVVTSFPSGAAAACVASK
jgi:hypothetical protein